ncbi:kinase [Xanthomonas perforans]|nr:kinase [Xanthomonas perforans]
MVKDYGRYRRTLLSPIARLMVRHEARMLRQLQGWRHAPALLGTLGGLALGMEFIPGDTLSASTVVGQEVFQQLQQALRRLHAFGITHNDLHGTNVVVSAGVPRRSQRLAGIAPTADESARSAEPRWVHAIRSGWKRLYRRLKGKA